MTEINADADIDIVWTEQELTVRIPLAGEVPLEWCERYQGMAHRKNIPARAEQSPERTWIVVALPASIGRSDVVATMDAARDLITDVDASEESQGAEETETTIRQWWAKQRD
jgi:hypothetical protein